jgi:hypothetical protein
MSVEQLIEQLSKINDKTQEVKFFSNEFEFGLGFEVINSIQESTDYDGENIVILQQSANQ